MPGNGLRQTSSPTAPVSAIERPSESTTSIALPSAGPPSEQALIGTAGVGDRKHAPTSVPPEQLMIGQRPPPTCSNSHRYGSGFHGSPVVTITRSDERSRRSTSSAPCGISARTSVGESPRIDTRSLSTTLVRDRKSTRLNSSHDQISYAVFCLKKNKTIVTSALILATIARRSPF